MEQKNSMTAKSSGIQEEGIRAVPDPEVSEKAIRRRFTADYKLRILKEADACTQPGQIGVLLRREGIYSSNLAKWRHQASEGLIPKRRGPVPQKQDPNVHRIAELEKENSRLAYKLKQAELIIEVQKKVAAILEKTGKIS